MKLSTLFSRPILLLIAMGCSVCSGQPKLDSKLGFPSATAGGNPPFAVCGLRQL